MPDSVIIVAGGSGSRFGGNIPKQFLNLRGTPILRVTMEVFYSFNPELEFIIVLPKGHRKTWEEYCRHFPFEIRHQVAEGGRERFHSVKTGLQLMSKGGIAGIHDAVRPLVAHETLKRCFKTAGEKGTAVPVIEPVDSLRELVTGGSRVVPRSSYRLVQTPQCFEKELILEAFSQEYQPGFTDDASVAEAAGHYIHLVEGNRENFKITTPADLKMAEALFVGK